MGLQARKEAIIQYAASVMVVIRSLQEHGIVTYSHIARSLNTLAIPTSRPGGRWRPARVRNVIRSVEPEHRSPFGSKPKRTSCRSRYVCDLGHHYEALERARALAPLLAKLHGQSITSNVAVAAAFNKMGTPTLRRGATWRGCQIHRLRQRLLLVEALDAARSGNCARGKPTATKNSSNVQARSRLSRNITISESRKGKR